LTFRLDEIVRVTETLCRCGTHLPGGQLRLEVSVSSGELRHVFHDHAFCSLVCLRAFVRESIETLDAAVDGHSHEVCSDLRELILDLGEVWDALERAHPMTGRSG